MRMTFLQRLEEALALTAQAAVIAQDVQAAPVDPETLKPVGAPRTLRAGHHVIIVGRRVMADVRAAAAGDEGASEHVWFTPAAGGPIFLAHLPGGTYRTFFRDALQLSATTLPLNTQAALRAFGRLRR
jgi:hypothetical protein